MCLEAILVPLPETAYYTISFSSCIAGMKCAVTDYFASIVLCGK